MPVSRPLYRIDVFKTSIAAAAGLALFLSDPASASILTGTGAGSPSHVRLFPSIGAPPVHSFFAFNPSFLGGVRVASGDISGSLFGDMITGAGPGATPQVSVFNGTTGALMSSFFAYDGTMNAGIFVGGGDVTGDNIDDIITGPDQGFGPHVRVFNGVTQAVERSFFAYGANFTGGVRVSSGDVNNDGIDDIITGAGASGSGHVKVFDGGSGSEIRSFFAFGAGFGGGVFVAGGDVNGDGHSDIITSADMGFAPQVRVFDGLNGNLINSFDAFGPSFMGGVRVAAADLDGDGKAEIVAGAGPGGLPQVSVYNGLSGMLLGSFLAYDPGFTGGVYVGAHPVPAPAGLLVLAGAVTFGIRRRRRSA